MATFTAGDRYWARRELRGLDPVADNERIVHLSAEVRYGDPVLTALLYTVAFARQMAVPSIAGVVHRGGRSPIMRQTRQRNDDTMTFFGLFMSHGHSSERGRAAIARLNDIHSRFPITNEQSLYTLASLTFEAERIPRLLGTELLTEQEKLAYFYFWHGVGERMHLHDMPDTYNAFWTWTLDYEARNYGFSHGGRAVVDAMLADYTRRFFPAAVVDVGRALMRAAMNDDLLDTHRLDRPKPGTRQLMGGALRAYRAARRVLPDPAERSWTETYADGGGGCPHLAVLGDHSPARHRQAHRRSNC